MPFGLYNALELHKVLGLFFYYKCFIKDFAQIADPMYQLLKKNMPYEWTEQQQKAFEQLREMLTKAPVVRYSNFNKPFYLYTDASNISLGAVLAQKDGKQKYVIAYASRTLNPAEKNYGITELECLAIIWAVKYFRYYLYGNKFMIITDHVTLKWLSNLISESANKRLERWKITLSKYEYEIIYRKGSNHLNADAFSCLNSTSNLTHFNTQPRKVDHG